MQENLGCTDLNAQNTGVSKIQEFKKKILASPEDVNRFLQKDEWMSCSWLQKIISLVSLVLMYAVLGNSVECFISIHT